MAGPRRVSSRTAWIHHLPALALQLLRAGHSPAQELVRGQSSERGGSGGEGPAEASLDVPVTAAQPPCPLLLTQPEISGTTGSMETANTKR